MWLSPQSWRIVNITTTNSKLLYALKWSASKNAPQSRSPRQQTMLHKILVNNWPRKPKYAAETSAHVITIQEGRWNCTHNVFSRNLASSCPADQTRRRRAFHAPVTTSLVRHSNRKQQTATNSQSRRSSVHDLLQLTSDNIHLRRLHSKEEEKVAKYRWEELVIECCNSGSAVRITNVVVTSVVCRRWRSQGRLLHAQTAYDYVVLSCTANWNV
jgi:hypothetical protein